jgi:hypothetical protein
MGKIRVGDLARMMGISDADLIFKLRTIGVQVSGYEPSTPIELDVISAILQGKRLPHHSRASTTREKAPSTPQKENSIAIQKKELERATNFRAFLCHASPDKPAVRNLYQRLLVDSIYPWLDEEELLPGQNWRREIERILRRIPAVIVCLSRNSITKQGYVQREIKTALDLLEEQPDDSIFVIPVRLEECDVPDRLSHLHYCDLYRDSGYNRLSLALHFRAQQLGLRIQDRSHNKVGGPNS